MDPIKRTPPSLPVDRKARFVTPAAIELLKLFDTLVHEHREAKFKTKPRYGESQDLVLGAVTHFQNHLRPTNISLPTGNPFSDRAKICRSTKSGLVPMRDVPKPRVMPMDWNWPGRRSPALSAWSLLRTSSRSTGDRNLRGSSSNCRPCGISTMYRG